MASGDTKTEALLNILGHGGSVDGITGSGNTKTQDYLVDAIERLQRIEDEISGGGGSVTFYSTVSLTSAADNVSLYSDKACTNAIQTSTFFQAIRSGKTVSIEYGGSGDFDNRQIHKIIYANITNVDTADAYDEVGPSATYFVGNGTKRIYPANPDPTSTNGFSIGS